MFVERLPAVPISLAKSINGMKQPIIRKGKVPQNFNVVGFPGNNAVTPNKDG